MFFLTAVAAANLPAADLELKPETLRAWDDYIQKAKVQIQERAHGGSPFLLVDGDADRMAHVRAGEIVVWPASENSPKRAPCGLIHDWISAGFIPNAHIEDVIGVLRDYPRYKEMYKPVVLDAKLVQGAPTKDQFDIVLRNNGYFSSTVLQGEYQSAYTQVDAKRWYGFSITSRLEEIDNYGQANERKHAPDEGHGYIWRIARYTQFEERDGGVYIVDEAMALSRDLPMAVRWMAGPIIRRVAREAMSASLQRTRAAVQKKLPVTMSADRSTPESAGCVRAGLAGCIR